ncbi:ATP-binding protein [Aureimonas sp. ME7]|uniref:sensor histidine kinase n=1 Tax=Aureimonas sp. ME7 TaxID=2744252 RepID=UPI0015F63D1D|nr:ATP-binding protein [Aureimonas sp. ME7]
MHHDIRPTVVSRSWRPAAVLALAFVCLAAWHLSGEWGLRSGLAALDERARTALPLAVSVLRSEVDKQRSVPAVLAEDPDIRSVLADPTPPRVDHVNARLEQLRATTGATVLYLLDTTGLTIAASNYDEPTSFVGSDYGFRPYFREAMERGEGAQYALGTVSQRPGLYLTRRVDAGGRPLGVVVLKVELGGVEGDWVTSGNTVFVSDEEGIILATSRPDWRYRTLGPVRPDRIASIRDSLQFGAAPLTPIGLRNDGGLTSAADTGDAQSFVAAERVFDDPVLRWTVHLWIPADAAIEGAMLGARLQALSLASVLATLGFLAARRTRRIRARRLSLEAASAELERRVLARTRELRDANLRLQDENRTRRAAEERADTLRRELEQANRLASLGQITAGVAHEINQPVAAIRTYAENAERFLDRADETSTRRNLQLVVGLTERIGRITDTLKGHARRGTGELAPVRLSDAVDGAAMVLQGRLQAAGIAIDRGTDLSDLFVSAERLRLEQVLVILVQNGLEAQEGRMDGRIRIEAAKEDGMVRLDVRDGGPGIAPDRLATLFTPFSTSKARGLGLGLVIAKDIITEWGGSLAARNDPEGGAVFTLRLRAGA